MAKKTKPQGITELEERLATKHGKCRELESLIDKMETAHQHEITTLHHEGQGYIKQLERLRTEVERLIKDNDHLVHDKRSLLHVLSLSIRARE